MHGSHGRHARPSHAPSGPNGPESTPSPEAQQPKAVPPQTEALPLADDEDDENPLFDAATQLL